VHHVGFITLMFYRLIVERTLLKETCWNEVAANWKRHNNDCS
jgi:hypothetical protein